MLIVELKSLICIDTLNVGISRKTIDRVKLYLNPLYRCRQNNDHGQDTCNRHRNNGNDILWKR